jgi:hypothetical protein
MAVYGHCTGAKYLDYILKIYFCRGSLYPKIVLSQQVTKTNFSQSTPCHVIYGFCISTFNLGHMQVIHILLSFSHIFSKIQQVFLARSLGHY